MIETKAIRKRIIDLAIKGLLTEQLPSDGTSEELLNHIKTELDISHSKQKTEFDEAPFEIPSTWSWTRLKDITSANTLNDGDWVVSEKMVPNGPVKLIQLGSIGDLKYKNAGFKYLTEDCFKELNGKQIFPGYLLINRIVTDKMLSCIIPEIDGILMTAVDACWVAPKEDYYDIKYLMYAISSSCFQKKVKEIGYGVTRFRISKTNLINIFFPFPPLAEQKRIVDKIEHLFMLLDNIDDLQAKHDYDFETIKKKLVYYAIQGKLVPQDESEGTGEELFRLIQEEKSMLIKEGIIKKGKKLTDISVDEIPFDIPNTWKWVRIGSIVNSIFAGGDKPSDFSEKRDATHLYPVIANGVANEGILGYTSVPTAKANTVTVAGRGTIGFSVFREYEYCPIVRLIVLETNKFVNPKYIQRVLQALPEASTGTSTPQLTVPKLAPKLIPLPPLSEQNRIVEKLEDIFKLIDNQ